MVYIYTLAKASEPNIIKYVGKTNDIKDRLKRHLQKSYLKDTTPKTNWIKSVLNNNDTIIMEILDIVP